MTNFVELNMDELENMDGGFIVTGTMIATGIGCIASGVAVGYAVGTIFERFF